MGNHEMKHIQAADSEKSPSKPELITRHQFGDDYNSALDYMRSLPSTLNCRRSIWRTLFLSRRSCWRISVMTC